MKNHLALLLLLTCSVLLSCSIVDDKEPGEEIIGNWKLIEINDPTIYDLDVCLGDTRIRVKEEGEVMTTYYDPSADCAEKVSEGSWQFLEEDQYILEVLPKIGPTEGRVNFESIHIFDFYTSFNNEVVIFTFERI